MYLKALLVALMVAAASHDAVAAQNSTNSTYDALDYVDQLIGSSNGGKESSGTCTGETRALIRR